MLQTSLALAPEYLVKGVEHNAVAAYYKYMVKVVKILGKDSEEVKGQLRDSLNFEIKLAQVKIDFYLTLIIS